MSIDSPIGRLIMQPARIEELPIVIQILDEAAVGLSVRGIRQWLSPPPPNVWDLMRAEIQKQQVYLAFTPDGQAIGTLRFAWRDHELWPEYPDNAGYVYTLAIRARVMGQGVGVRILDWAKDHIRSYGKPFIRLDCIESNFKLRAYYERLGFYYCGTAVQQGYRLARYEMRLEPPFTFS